MVRGSSHTHTFSAIITTTLQDKYYVHHKYEETESQRCYQALGGTILSQGGSRSEHLLAGRPWADPSLTEGT